MDIILICEYYTFHMYTTITIMVRYLVRYQGEEEDLQRKRKYNMVLWRDNKETRIGVLNRDMEERTGKSKECEEKQLILKTI